MSPLQLYNTRTRAKQTFVPADPSGQVGRELRIAASELARSQIERLQQAGAAYATADGIYFDLTAFPEYGRRSGRTKVLRGDPVSRLDANPHKRNAGDFVLRRFADADRIRDQLAAHGVILEDSSTGVRWRRSTR